MEHQVGPLAAITVSVLGGFALILARFFTFIIIDERVPDEPTGPISQLEPQTNMPEIMNAKQFGKWMNHFITSLSWNLRRAYSQAYWFYKRVTRSIWILLIINRLTGQEMTHTGGIFRSVPEVTMLLWPLKLSFQNMNSPSCNNGTRLPAATWVIQPWRRSKWSNLRWFMTNYCMSRL